MFSRVEIQTYNPERLLQVIQTHWNYDALDKYVGEVFEAAFAGRLAETDENQCYFTLSTPSHGVCKNIW